MKPFQFKGSYTAEKTETRPLDRALIIRLLSYLKPYKAFLAIAFLFLIGSKAIEAYIPAYIGIVSNEILNAISLGEREKTSLLTSVLHGCLWALALLGVSFLLDVFNVWLKSWIGQKALLTLRLEVYRHIQRMSLSYYDKNSVGRLMTRTIHDVDQINQMFSESVVPLFGNIFLFICIAIGCIIIDWRVALALGAIMPAAFWLTNQFRINQRICYEKIRIVVAAMNTFIQEHLMGASVVRNFGLEKQERKKFEEINEDHCNVYLQAINNFSFFVAGIDVIQNFTLIATFAVLAAFAPVSEGFSAATFFTFSLYALMIFRPLADLAERYNVLQAAMASAGKIFAILDTPIEEQGPAEGPPLDEIHSIVFEDVWCAYDKDHWVLKGVSFKIGKGESLAVVGTTGAGKSTLMGLLMRLYDFQKGKITVNGHDIREYPLNVLRRQFSVVLQDPVIFSGSILDNITLCDEEISADRVESVIDYIAIRPFIDRFPEGIHHVLSERGKSLSAGEMQLISMARAVIHSGSVLILDEATANIDTGTEKIIQNALSKILKEKTALIVAHRLSTIQDATRIVVLNNGVIAEAGTHHELLQARGIYEKLYRLQFMNV